MTTPRETPFPRGTTESSCTNGGSRGDPVSLGGDLKRCRRCKTNLPRSEFCRDASNRDGLQWRCRHCHSAMKKEYRKRYPEKVRATQRDSRARHLEASRAGYRRRDKRRGTPTASRLGSPAQRRARHQVNDAITRGEMVRPDRCPSCGTNETKIHAHHHDYTKPLDVQFLCARCHGRLHTGLIQ